MGPECLLDLEQSRLILEARFLFFFRYHGDSLYVL
jgi:hypothetical protein